MKTRARVHRAIHRELALLGVQDVEVRVSSTNGGSIDRPIEAQRLADERARLTALTPRSSLRRIVGEN